VVHEIGERHGRVHGDLFRGNALADCPDRSVFPIPGSPKTRCSKSASRTNSSAATQHNQSSVHVCFTDAVPEPGDLADRGVHLILCLQADYLAGQVPGEALESPFT